MGLGFCRLLTTMGDLGQQISRLLVDTHNNRFLVPFPLFFLVVFHCWHNCISVSWATYILIFLLPFWSEPNKYCIYIYIYRYIQSSSRRRAADSTNGQTNNCLSEYRHQRSLIKSVLHSMRHFQGSSKIKLEQFKANILSAHFCRVGFCKTINSYHCSLHSSIHTRAELQQTHQSRQEPTARWCFGWLPIFFYIYFFLLFLESSTALAPSKRPARISQRPCKPDLLLLQPEPLVDVAHIVLLGSMRGT